MAIPQLAYRRRSLTWNETDCPNIFGRILVTRLNSDSPMNLQIRPFEDGDHEASARVFSEVFPDFPITGNDSRRVRASRRNPFSIVARTPGTGRAVGFGEIWQESRMNYPGKYWGWVLVDPEYQGRGIGARVYDCLMSELCKLGAETVWVNARDDYPQHLRFVRRRGFHELWRNITQRLCVREVDLSGIEDMTDQARERGTTIVTLSKEIQENADYLRDLSELQNLIEADVPRAGYFTPATYDEFVDGFLRGTHLPDGYFLAKHGEKYVGLSYLQTTEGDPRILEIGLTGIRPEYRRQGIARLLKLHTIKYASERGFDAIETGSNSSNDPILTLNESVGFHKTYAWVTFEKSLHN